MSSTTGRELISLGLDNRDRLNSELGGGIPRGSIVLIEGEYGAGKSALTQRFSYGMCEEGNTVTLLSTELTTRGFVDQMHSLDYNMEGHLLDENILFLHGDIDTSDTLRGSDDESERMQLFKRLMEAEAMWEADVVMIDTFDAVLRNDPNFEELVREGEERQAALEIIDFFRDIIAKGKIVILTVDPTTVDDDVMGPFRSIADVYFQLQMIEVGNEVRRNISVKRFTGMGEQVGDTVGYSVRSGVGIVIENRSVA
ncbi:AAA family ATPase [Salinarchaeum sp. IM2453]|uniref:ATPase domain-containing protein n=1 Tax=Salinarchaeum sp. IM2453 TaxID=2862870 RepID=UPI001C82963F|nr:ATPase domain-containing protein [Salinarchaeum sp. IM2453]QZA87456.1 AAA family ATPase [Salinarchaeum sp. IM2453]